MSRVVKNFESRQCMSRVVTNRVRQNLVLQSLSDDLKKKKKKKKKTARVGTQESAVKKNSQGRNPRIRKTKKSSANCRQKSSANSRQRSESVMAVRRFECETKLQSGETQFWCACEEDEKLKLVRRLVRSL